MSDLSIKLYVVGGAIRDMILGKATNDVDFSVVVSDPTSERNIPVEESYAFMRDWLISQGYKIHLESPEYVTVRVGVPEHLRHPKFPEIRDADFVLARREGPYSDGRRPDWVVTGTLEDDLARRDFTCNAMAMDTNGNIIDPHGGRSDLALGFLAFVGVPDDRITEDPLRILRGLRFLIQCDLESHVLDCILKDRPDHYAKLLQGVSEERRQVELNKMLKLDQRDALNMLTKDIPVVIYHAIFHGRPRLIVTRDKYGNLSLEVTLKDA